MLAYKLKVIHVEDDTINVLPVRNNDSTYPRVYNNHGDDYGTVLPEYGYVFCNGVPDKGGFIISNITTSTDLVLLSLHIGGIKYRV